MRDAPTSGIVEVFMPRRPGHITKRTDIAGAHSLNETDRPARKGETPAELTAGLNEIIDYLASDKSSHKRYKPRQRPDLLQHLRARLLFPGRRVPASGVVDSRRH